jgi:hypothetical protein
MMKQTPDARSQRPDAGGLNAAILAAILSLTCAAHALEPAALAIVSVREEPVANASETYFYSGHPLLLTNCIAYSGASTSSAPQNLSNVAVIVKLGVPTNNVAYTGAVANAAAGTWWARIEALPTNWDAPYLFLQLTNAAETFGYPFKTLKVKNPL